jgi:hypothetical protein
MMKPCQIYKKKALKKGRGNKTRGKDQKSRPKNSPKEVSYKEVREPLSIETSTRLAVHIN